MARRGFVRRFLSEPFLHFLAIGAVIYAAAHFWNGDPDRYRIFVGPDQAARLSDTYSKQYGRAPDRAQLQVLIDQDIREEILYREGMALNLEKRDQIVRRRVAQKFEFLQLDLDSPTTVTTADLSRYYEAHSSNYLTQPTVSFTHVFLAAGTNEPETRARALLQHLQRSGEARAPDAGDPFAGPYDYAALDRSSLSRVFGESAIVSALFDAPEHSWAGPFRSAYGWHLVYVTSREPGRRIPLDEIRDRVATDSQEDARRTQNLAAFARLRSKYVIVHDARSTGDSRSTSDSRSSG